MSKRRRLLMRWGAVIVGAAVLAALWALAANRRADPTAVAPGESVSGLTSVLDRHLPDEAVTLRFEEVAAETGLDFHHLQARRSSLLPEDMGPGLAWGDYDDDGDPDLYLVNFRGALHQDPPGQAAPALFRNDGGTFVEVTEEAGLGEPHFGIGAVWADYDADGDLDLYVTAFGPNRLYRNDGGRFTEVAAELGLDDPGFGAGAAWADYDRDGDIDLYLTNYVVFDADEGKDQGAVSQYGEETPYTINPSAYAPAANRLYRNDGQGGFEEVAMEAGVANPEGRSLSVAWVDFDDDAWPDLYIANDVSDNGAFRNLGDGRFQDIGASSLAADYRGAMGLAVADYDQDSDPDIFVTHWLAQENALFENMAADGGMDRSGTERLFFMDSADMVGLGQASLSLVGWATQFVDLDNDGDLDLWVVNGHTLQRKGESSRLIPQPLNLYQREGRDFYDVAEVAGQALAEPVVGRGGAEADFDGDGRLDLAVAVHGGPTRLFRNRSPETGHWLRLDLRQSGGNTRALGARVSLEAGERTWIAWHGIGGGYLSQSEPVMHFGLGEEAQVDRLTFRWPDGSEQVLRDIPTDQVLRITRRPQ